MSDFVWVFWVVFFGGEYFVVCCLFCFVFVGWVFFCVWGGCLLVFDLCFWGVLVVF